MLKYLISSIEQMISAMLITGLICAMAARVFRGAATKIVAAGIAAGTCAGAVMYCFKTYTNRIDTGRWNLRIFAVTLAAFVLFLLVTLFGRRLREGDVVPPVFLAVIEAMLLLYVLPDLLGYPHNILLTEKTVISTAFILKMIGVVLGVILTILAGIAVYKGASWLSPGLMYLLTVIVLLINECKQVASSFSIMLAKRIIPSNHTLFVIAKYASNYSNWFIFATMLTALVIPVVLWVRSFHVNEPYRNSAERRKIIAKWRLIRRWSTTAVIVMGLSVVLMTSVKTWAYREIELSPIEDAEVADGMVIVPFEKVSDGHLHRFGYKTENDVTIRFIVIQKPNSSAYGVGLDACDICGETGYYEKDGQVVCNLCDVVMNINTIGFKGGCNPIVIDYEIHDGAIRVPVEGLIEHEKTFKS